MHSDIKQRLLQSAYDILSVLHGEREAVAFPHILQLIERIENDEALAESVAWLICWTESDAVAALRPASVSLHEWACMLGEMVDHCQQFGERLVRVH